VPEQRRVRLGNCRGDVLIGAFARSLATVLTAFEDGDRIIEIA